jgi:hypothetical protein
MAQNDGQNDGMKRTEKMKNKTEGKKVEFWLFLSESIGERIGGKMRLKNPEGTSSSGKAQAKQQRRRSLQEKWKQPETWEGGGGAAKPTKGSANKLYFRPFRFFVVFQCQPPFLECRQEGRVEVKKCQSQIVHVRL